MNVTLSIDEGVFGANQDIEDLLVAINFLIGVVTASKIEEESIVIPYRN